MRLNYNSKMQWGSTTDPQKYMSTQNRFYNLDYLSTFEILTVTVIIQQCHSMQRNVFLINHW